MLNVLFAFDDLKETVGVHPRHVACAQPSIWREGICGIVRAVPVPLHDLRTAYQQLTDATRRQIGTGGCINDLRIGRWQGYADGRVALVR